MAVFTGDQPKTVGVVVGGVIENVPVASLGSALPRLSVYTFTAGGSLVRGSGTLHFRTGCSYSLDPTLLAAVQAAGFQIVQAFPGG